jgi:hypothetical protein
MDVLTAFFTCVVRKLNIILGFSWIDWSITIIPVSIFSIGAIRSTSLSLLSILSNYLLLVSYLTSSIYFINLSNQIIGVDEDCINKPDRPIPSGTMALNGDGS